MQPEYKLRITPAAEEDLDAIFAYVAEKLNAPVAALNLLDAFDNGFRSLCDTPYRCELSRNETLASKGYRRMVVHNHVALYLVNEPAKMVIIARVFYGAMDYEKYI